MSDVVLVGVLGTLTAIGAPLASMWLKRRFDLSDSMRNRAAERMEQCEHCEYCLEFARRHIQEWRNTVIMDGTRPEYAAARRIELCHETLPFDENRPRIDFSRPDRTPREGHH